MFKVKKIKRTWFICIGFAFFPKIAEVVLFIKREVVPTSRGNCPVSIWDIVKVPQLTLNTHGKYGASLLWIIASHTVQNLQQAYSKKGTELGAEGENIEKALCAPQDQHFALPNSPGMKCLTCETEKTYSFIGHFTPHVTHPPRLMMVTSNRKQKRLKLCF